MEPPYPAGDTWGAVHFVSLRFSGVPELRDGAGATLAEVLTKDLVDTFTGGEFFLENGGMDYVVEVGNLTEVSLQSATVHNHPILGNYTYQDDDPATGNLWVAGLSAWLRDNGDGTYSSDLYGNIQLGGDAGWVYSSFFGWTHFGPNAAQYSGWMHTDRFRWMKFIYPGDDTTQNPFLYVPIMNSWMSGNPDGTFYSFQWGLLVPQSLNRYQSSIFGGITTGEFGGWVSSDRFGWVWANGDQTWFWSDTRQEWLGVTPEGGIWSTAEGRFL